MPDEPDRSDYLSIADVARLRGVTKRTVYRWVVDGYLPEPDAWTVGRARRVGWPPARLTRHLDPETIPLDLELGEGGPR